MDGFESCHDRCCGNGYKYYVVDLDEEQKILGESVGSIAWRLDCYLVPYKYGNRQARFMIYHLIIEIVMEDVITLGGGFQRRLEKHKLTSSCTSIQFTIEYRYRIHIENHEMGR